MNFMGELRFFLEVTKLMNSFEFIVDLILWNYICHNISFFFQQHICQKKNHFKRKESLFSSFVRIIYKTFTQTALRVKIVEPGELSWCHIGHNVRVVGSRSKEDQVAWYNGIFSDSSMIFIEFMNTTWYPRAERPRWVSLLWMAQ